MILGDRSFDIWPNSIETNHLRESQPSEKIKWTTFSNGPIFTFHISWFFSHLTFHDFYPVTLVAPHITRQCTVLSVFCTDFFRIFTACFVFVFLSYWLVAPCIRPWNHLIIKIFPISISPSSHKYNIMDSGVKEAFLKFSVNLRFLLIHCHISFTNLLTK